MIEFTDIRIDDTDWRVAANHSGRITDRLLLATINAIAREVQTKAQEFAPIGKGENPGDRPGTLKREGIIRRDAHAFQTPFGDEGRLGEVVTDVHAIGGGFSVRGGDPLNRGRFSSASQTREPGFQFKGFKPGITFYEAEVLLNPVVRHAEWVHQGTGIYGPHHAPIVPRVAPYLVFHWHGRIWHKKSVRGQPAQPFLTEAYVYVNNIYTPARVSELRTQLAAEL